MPPLTIESASALVPGGGVPDPQEKAMQQQPKPPATLKVRVLRSFQDHQRNILRPDPRGREVHELPRVFALEMKAANKVEIVAEPAPEPAPEPDKKPNGKKGGRDA